MMTQKFLVITGGSKGIGKQIVQTFLNADYQVINIARTPIVLTFGETNGVLNIQADLTQDNIELHLEKELHAIIKQKSQICLVHNASCHAHDAVGQQPKKILNDFLSIGVIIPTQLNNLLLPLMAEKSSIIYMGSTLSEKAVKNAASYVISKHAVVGLMRATCQDLSDYSLHTCCICPGFTATDMLISHIGHDPNTMEWVKNKVGAKRLIEPQEIADIIFFASQNPALNGSVVHANLGQLET